MSYDHWKTTNPEDEWLGPDPDEEESDLSECDCCGEMKAGCVNTIYCGMDTHACPKCRDAEEDEYGDRADFEYDRNR